MKTYFVSYNAHYNYTGSIHAHNTYLSAEKVTPNIIDKWEEEIFKSWAEDKIHRVTIINFIEIEND